MSQGMSIVHTKTPPPRQLGANETLDTLTHWRTNFRTFYKRDSNYTYFVQQSVTWDPNHTTYGQVAEVVRDANGDDVLDANGAPTPTGLRRTAGLGRFIVYPSRLPPPFIPYGQNCTRN